MSSVSIPDLLAEVEVPEEGTLSRVVYKDDRLRLVVFAFDTGQELTEHRSSSAAIVQVPKGNIDFTWRAPRTVSPRPRGFTWNRTSRIRW